MKTSLVLEGGGMRGMYTAGILDVLMENSINVDMIIGVSAGAVFGCNFKSKQPGRAIRYNKRFCADPRYSSFRSFIKTGDWFGADFCYKDVPFKYDIFDVETYKKNPVKFYAVATDVLTGNPVYHEIPDGNENDLTWMRASASMPLVSSIVEVDGYKLLDGGMSDSIPLKKSIEMGYTKNIVVLTQVEGYQKKPNKMLPLIKMIYRKYPKIVEVMANRHKMYNDELSYVDEQKKNGNTFVIRPSRLQKVGRTEHNPEVLQKMYDLGREDAVKILPDLKKFLESEAN